jgi:hypothetical protein
VLEIAFDSKLEKIVVSLVVRVVLEAVLPVPSSTVKEINSGTFRRWEIYC